MNNSKVLYSNGIAIVKDLNQVDNEALLDLKKNDIIIRVLVSSTPDMKKIAILNEVLAISSERITLVLSSNKTNWINLSDFESLELLENIEIHNTSLDFDSIKGVDKFKNLKSLSLLYRYGKEIELELLSRCEQLEFLILDEPLTKKQHEKLSLIKSLRKVRLRNLTPSLMPIPLENIEYLEVFNLQESSIDSKFPKLKKIRIYNSNKIEDVNFLSSLYYLEWFFIYSVNKVSSLPDLSKLESLKTVYCRNMKLLKDITSLQRKNKLEGLCIKSTSVTIDTLYWLNPQDFPLMENLLVELKTKKDSNQILDRFLEVPIGRKFPLNY